MARAHNRVRLRGELPEIARAFRDKGVFAQMTFIERMSSGEGLSAAMQALDGAFFRPNCVFLLFPDDEDSAREEALLRVVRQASTLRTGVLLFANHPEAMVTVALLEKPASPSSGVTIPVSRSDLEHFTKELVDRNPATWDEKSIRLALEPMNP